MIWSMRKDGEKSSAINISRTLITLVFGFILTQVGYDNIWPLFGSANQLLSALVLITLCVFLKVTGRELRTLVPPFVIMLIVTFTALIQRFISLCSGIFSRNRCIYGRRSAADCGCAADDSGSYDCRYIRKRTCAQKSGKIRMRGLSSIPAIMILYIIGTPEKEEKILLSGVLCM